MIICVCVQNRDFLTIFSKGNNFSDFLLASLDDIAIRKWCLFLTLLHSEQPKLHRVLAVLSAIGLNERIFSGQTFF